MNPLHSKLLTRTLLLAALLSPAPGHAASVDYSRTIKAMARDIAALKRSYPQLQDFSPATNLDAQHLTISYTYRTHEAERRGGWTSGVPHPDEAGVWFYIDIHDPDSNAQIHTQPVTAAICIGNQRVSYLILEGARTKSLNAPIYKILRKHGARDCDRPRKRG